MRDIKSSNQRILPKPRLRRYLGACSFWDEKTVVLNTAYAALDQAEEQITEQDRKKLERDIFEAVKYNNITDIDAMEHINHHLNTSLSLSA